MYSIGEVSKLTGITAFTLRYYEKAGVLPLPGRKGGIRSYDDKDLRFIRFIHGLKQTGMSLEDIAAFTEDGCLLTRLDEEPAELSGMVHKRIDVLNRHIGRLDEQIRHLESVKALALRKSAYYSAVLDGNNETDRS